MIYTFTKQDPQRANARVRGNEGCTSMQSEPNPSGLCQCGCGQKTKLAPQTRSARKWVKGKPVRFVTGHVNKRSPAKWASSYVEQPGPLETPCWIWSGALDRLGYGSKIAFEGRSMIAHIAFYRKFIGPVPGGLACVNFLHVEPVTHAENMRRGAVAKLDWEQVRAIRARHQEGERGVDLARAFDVTASCINDIVHRHSWVAI